MSDAKNGLFSADSIIADTNTAATNASEQHAVSSVEPRRNATSQSHVAAPDAPPHPLRIDPVAQA